MEIDLVVTGSEHQSIPMLNLTDVYREHGPEVGWDELQRRSICPPTRSSEANLDTEIRREVGHLSLTTDYVELGHQNAEIVLASSRILHQLFLQRGKFNIGKV